MQALYGTVKSRFILHQTQVPIYLKTLTLLEYMSKLPDLMYLQLPNLQQ